MGQKEARRITFARAGWTVVSWADSWWFNDSKGLLYIVLLSFFCSLFGRVSEDYITISKMRWMKTNGQKRNGMECMNEWMKAQKNECRNEWLSWVNDSMNTRKNEWQNEWLHDRLCIYIYIYYNIYSCIYACMCVYIYNYIHICSLYGRMELLSLLRGLLRRWWWWPWETLVKP